jgi:hypothetical protein
MSQLRFFFGFFFVTLGCLSLINNFSPFFELDELWRLWPMILLLLGVSSLIKIESIKRVIMSFIGIIAGIIIFGGIHGEEVKIVHFDNEEIVSEISDSVYVPYDPLLSDTSFLSISAGAASFDISSTNDSSLIVVKRDSEVIEEQNEVNGGNIDESNDRSSFSIDHKINDGKNNINLEFGGNLTLFGNRKLKSANILLNTKALWNIDIDGGASSMNADLSALRIGTLNLEVGASSIALRLGSMHDSSTYYIKGGAAKFLIEIPHNAGCRITKESGLSRHHFPGLIQKSDVVFESPNYAKSTKKINLDIQTGVSSITVQTYTQKTPELPLSIPDTNQKKSSDTLVIKPNGKSKQL